ncbi:MAG: hypothetical protein Q8P04_01760 [bacterium]|nr:hypothetical protein [bacterium]
MAGAVEARSVVLQKEAVPRVVTAGVVRQPVEAAMHSVVRQAAENYRAKVPARSAYSLRSLD